VSLRSWKDNYSLFI